MSTQYAEKPTEITTMEKDSYSTSDVERESSMSEAEEAAMRKRVLWKLDTRILPVLAVLFLFSFLDRVNIVRTSGGGLQDLPFPFFAFPLRHILTCFIEFTGKCKGSWIHHRSTSPSD